MMEKHMQDVTTEDVYGDAKASRFHFKPITAPRRDRPKDTNSSNHISDRTRKRHRSHRDDKVRRRQRHRRESPDRKPHTTSTRNGTYYNPEYRNRESMHDDLGELGDNSRGMPSRDAFRESLFDALADDEGAAYWEGVYGQPIHVYPDSRPGPDGKFERMTEEEYADFVRRKMWEKTHQHIIEEREARAQARQDQREQRHRMKEKIEQEELERERIQNQVEKSLQRGERRKLAKQAEVAWERYTSKWEQLKSIKNYTDEQVIQVRDVIPWPVITGRAGDVQKDQIEHFLRSSSGWKSDPITFLKTERVRWHPDKMQQRFGHHMDAETMRSVTAVFQVVDRLWKER